MCDHHMKGHRGLWLAFGGGRRADRIGEHIDLHDTFTLTLSVQGIARRKAEVVIVSLTGESADHIGGNRPRHARRPLSELAPNWRCASLVGDLLVRQISPISQRPGMPASLDPAQVW